MFLVAIQVEALDRPRLLSDVTRVLSDQHVNILSASVTTTRDRVAVSRFTFEMGDPKHLGHVLKAVRNIDGVYDVYRVTSSPGLRPLHGPALKARPSKRARWADAAVRLGQATRTRRACARPPPARHGGRSGPLRRP